MNQPPNPNQSVSSTKTKFILVIIFLAILLLTFGILVGLVLRQRGFQLPAPATQTQSIPTMFFPTADCGSPILLLGTATFEIKTVAPALDGSLSVPADTSDIAYWVEGTDTNYVFVLSLTPQNLALMQTVTVGSTAKATWADCSSTTYSLSAPQQSSLDGSASSDQSSAGITIFFETDPSGAGVMVNGELTEEEITTFNTPASEPSEIQAGIGLLETTSEDGDTIRVSASVYNYGEAEFTLLRE
jgi:hypothetical protein